MQSNAKLSASSFGRTSQDLSQSDRTSSRCSEADVSFILHGTPAPRCPRKTVKPKLKPIPPPNSPFATTAAPRLVPLPIDRIMALRDRLEESAMPKKSEDSDLTSSSNLDRFNHYPRQFWTDSRPNFTSQQSNINESVSYKKETLSLNFESKLSFTERGNSLTSSHPDLSIDLSSVNNSDNDTDSSTDSAKGYYCNSGTESSRRTNCGSSPLFVPQYHSAAKIPLRRSSYFSSETSSGNSSSSIPRKTIVSLPLFTTASSSSSRYPISSLDESSRTYNTHSRRSADLICVYVDTVSKNKLAKYLRPCVQCNEPCCVCPQSPRSCDEAKPIMDYPYGSVKSEEGDLGKSFHGVVISERKSCDMTLIEPKTDEQPPKSPEEKPLGSQRSDFSQFMLERVRRSDSGNCTLDDKSHNSILSKRHVSLSLMQLSTAAQCARILADSLEGVLQLAKEEVISMAESPDPSDVEAPDSLRTALDTLQRAYPNDAYETFFPLVETILPTQNNELERQRLENNRVITDINDEECSPLIDLKDKAATTNLKSSTCSEEIVHGTKAIVELTKLDQTLEGKLSSVHTDNEPDIAETSSLGDPPTLDSSMEDSYFSHSQCSRCREINAEFTKGPEPVVSDGPC